VIEQMKLNPKGKKKIAPVNIFERGESNPELAAPYML
jgi:hypothetical protein